MSKLSFFLSYLRHPARTGSVIPSSVFLSRRIARAIEHMERCPIVELGGGTGAITRHIARYQPTVIEIDRALARLLRDTYPECTVENRCAVEFLDACTHNYGCVISLPLINNPQRARILTSLATAYQRGQLRWCIIFTYGATSPLEALPFRSTHNLGKVLINFPPATVWAYE